MWHNNGGYGSNGQFQSIFNQEGYLPSEFPGQSIQGQQYFAQQPSMTQYEEQPQVDLFNDGLYTQNQFNTQDPRPQQQFSSPPYNMQQGVTLTPRAPTQINARAAELKAELLKRREGRATPPVLTILAQAAKHTSRENGSSSRTSPRTSNATAEKPDQELNLNELISQYSEAKPTASTTVKKENVNPIPASTQRTPSHIGAKLQAPSLGSPSNATEQINAGVNKAEMEKQIDNAAKEKTLGNRHPSNGSISEGEIIEDKETKLKASMAATRGSPKQAQIGAKDLKIDEASSRKSRDERSNNLLTRPSRDKSPSRRAPLANSDSLAPRNRADRREDIALLSEKRTYWPDYKLARNQRPDPEPSTYQRRETRVEDDRRPEPKSMSRPDINQQRRDEINYRPVREQKPPSLEELLPLDEDLREWLDITGYHNIPYRSKILSRRRAIAALDAQRDQLLAEMEAEERGGLPVISGGQVPTSFMRPPPILNKAGIRAEYVATPARDLAPEPLHDQVVSKKRPYSDDGEPRGESNACAKIARTDNRGYELQKINGEDSSDYRRSQTTGFDAPRRSPQYERRERDTSRPRYDSRARSRERESSSGPGRRPFDGRPPARGRGYDSFTFYDGDEVERGRSGYEHQGGYQGRAYDPNYRGRGRGRGRGNSRDGRVGREFDPNSDKMETGSGTKIANGKPFRDPKGFDKGGRGETRYFIVKSFNEENVLRCIQDSIWTTQLQNGRIFTEAFESCKNVILVFSINKSRAFQGYARMESLPGSVESPEWQRVINWESAGAFRVRWLVVCSTRFHRIGHLKNALNDNLAVLIGKDGQEIEENCGAALIEFIDEEVDLALTQENRYDDRLWDE